MDKKIQGVVEAVSVKFSGGLKIDGNWYNGNSVTELRVKACQKGETVSLTLDEKGKIKFLEKSEFKTADNHRNGIEETARLRRELDWDLAALNNAVLLCVNGKIPLEKIAEKFSAFRQLREYYVDEVLAEDQTKVEKVTTQKIVLNAH